MGSGAYAKYNIKIWDLWNKTLWIGSSMHNKICLKNIFQNLSIFVYRLLHWPIFNWFFDTTQTDYRLTEPLYYPNTIYLLVMIYFNWNSRSIRNTGRGLGLGYEKPDAIYSNKHNKKIQFDEVQDFKGSSFKQIKGYGVS